MNHWLTVNCRLVYLAEKNWVPVVAANQGNHILADVRFKTLMSKHCKCFQIPYVISQSSLKMLQNGICLKNNMLFTEFHELNDVEWVCIHTKSKNKIPFWWIPPGFHGGDQDILSWRSPTAIGLGGLEWEVDLWIRRAKHREKASGDVDLWICSLIANPKDQKIVILCYIKDY